jgi:hypothetical protein
MTLNSAPYPVPVIPASQKAEIRRIEVPSQAWHILRKTLSQKHPFIKKG